MKGKKGLIVSAGASSDIPHDTVANLELHLCMHTQIHTHTHTYAHAQINTHTSLSDNGWIDPSL